MTVPGIVLSHPEMATRPSSEYPRATSSIESAMISRLTREVRIPSVPMLMPSEIAMVLNSTGVPPAARTPAFTCSETPRRWELQGIISIHVLAIPIRGLRRSSSVNPMA